MNVRKILPAIVFIITTSLSLAAQEQRNDSIRLYPVRVNGKAGYIDGNGNVVIKPQFNRAWKFAGDLAIVETKERIRGDEPVMAYINKQGKLNFVDGASDYSEGLAIVGSPEKGLRVIDEAGKVIFKLPNQVSGVADRFSDGMVAVQLKNCIPYETCGKHGYMDKSGRVVIEPKWSYAREFQEGIAVVNNRDDWSFINKNGEEITKQPFAGWLPVTDFSEGLAGVKVGEKWGYINKTGEMIIPPQFEWAKKFTEGLAAVRVGCLWGYIDKTATFVIKPAFGFASEFSEGLAAIDPNQPKSATCPHVASHGRLGYIDKTGKLVIDAQFNLAFQFSEGIAEIVIVNPKNENDLKHGYIDKTGKYIWKPTS